LFVTEDRFDEGVSALRAVAKQSDAELESLRTAPHFRRFLVRRREEGGVVDLVYDPVPQSGLKQTVEQIRVDGPDEIMANKLCALLTRAELRDLVDVRALEQSGCDLEEALAAAMSKDAGLTPAQLAWVLSGITIGDDANIPGGGSPGDLRAYLETLRSRLERLALP